MYSICEMHAVLNIIIVATRSISFHDDYIILSDLIYCVINLSDSV